MHVITALDVGGAESMLAALATAKTTVFEQRVVSMVTGGAHVARLRHAGVPVDELGFQRGIPDIRHLWRLSRLVQLHKPDVIQSWMYHADLAALFALGLSGRRRFTRLAWGIRCSDMDTRQYGPLLRATIRLCISLSGRPDAVVANSEAGLAAHKRRGYAPRRAAVIYNGIDAARFRPDPVARAEIRRELSLEADDRVVAHVARVDPMKDHQTLLSAMNELPDVSILAIGLGTENLPESHNLYRLGRRDDVPRLLAASDLIVSSSAFGEGFCNAIAEGMSAELPAVATDVGDSRTIIGETGLIVPPRDPFSLATAIRRVLNEESDSVRHERGIRARARIKTNFSLETAVKRFEMLWQELATEAAP
jgi:glycosyltransferase involved in cell wall biosynthesis